MKKHKIQNVREPANEYEAELVEDAKRFSISVSKVLYGSFFSGMGTMSICSGIGLQKLAPIVFGTILILGTGGICLKKLATVYNLYNKRVEDIECFLDMSEGEEIEGAKIK